VLVLLQFRGLSALVSIQQEVDVCVCVGGVGRGAG